MTGWCIVILVAQFCAFFELYSYSSHTVRHVIYNWLVYHHVICHIFFKLLFNQIMLVDMIKTGDVVVQFCALF